MLDRRHFNKVAMATCLVSSGCGSGSPNRALVSPSDPLAAHRTGALPLARQQSRLDLGITVGALIGAAIGITAYTVFTRSAPSPLIGVFVAAIGGLGGATLTQAARDYIDFEIEEANGDLRRANGQLRQRVASDGNSFKILADYAVSQSRSIQQRQNDTSVSFRILRKEMHDLRLQVEQMRAESARAQKTSSTYTSAEQAIRVTRLDPQSQTNQQIDGAMQEAHRCKQAFQDLVGVVLSNS